MLGTLPGDYYDCLHAAFLQHACRLVMFKEGREEGRLGLLVPSSSSCQNKEFWEAFPFKKKKNSFETGFLIHGPDWPGTYCVDLAGLGLRNPLPLPPKCWD